MKKIIIIVLSIIILLVLFSFITFGYKISKATKGNITYKYADKNVSEKLTENEIKILKEILKNKARPFYADNGHVAGFNKNVYFKLDSMKFYITCDNCGIIRYKGKDISISDSDREKINEIFDKYVGAHMCI